MAGRAHPIPFAVLFGVSAVSCGIGLNAMSGSLKWCVCVPLFLAAIWIGSLLIVFVLKLPGFPPH
jgi:hypothetical protein